MVRKEGCGDSGNLGAHVSEDAGVFARPLNSSWSSHVDGVGARVGERSRAIFSCIILSGCRIGWPRTQK